MKKFLLVIAILCGATCSYAQFPVFDSLQQLQSQNRQYRIEKMNTKDYRGIVALGKNLLQQYEELMKKEGQIENKNFPNWFKSGTYYDMACGYAQLGESENAIAAFKEAVDYGYNSYRSAFKIPELDPIRTDPRFLESLEEIHQRYDTLYALKKANGYMKDPNQNKPTFTYQSADSPELVNLRKTLNLDGIAGKGDEISKMKNIMEWLHNTVRHDGGNPVNPTERNTLAMMELCKKENRGVNCRILAIMLNECYLAMGWKSRYVTCRPRYEKDTECHVINVVYSETLKKWIWMDPTWNAYITDENGNLLGIREVRDRLRINQPLILNDANWNNEIKTTKERYLYSYMAKNLYWFTCSSHFAYNQETRGAQIPFSHINLNPIGFANEYTLQINNYHTNDADYFWQVPE